MSIHDSIRNVTPIVAISTLIAMITNEGIQTLTVWQQLTTALIVFAIVVTTCALLHFAYAIVRGE